MLSYSAKCIWPSVLNSLVYNTSMQYNFCETSIYKLFDSLYTINGSMSMNGLASEGTATPRLDDACSLLPPQAAELADLDGDTSSKRMKINVID